jgi:predicted nucleic acid-binding protein
MQSEYKAIFLDTNILVYSSLKDFDNEKNKICTEWINRFFSQGIQIFISTQIIREFYAVVTNEKYLIKPLLPEQAVSQINFFVSNLSVLTIDMQTIVKMQELLVKYNIKGQNIHDTTIVATMLRYGINHIATFNTKDFLKFDNIEVLEVSNPIL